MIDIAEVEREYPVADITVDGEQIWPYLRIRYAFYGEGENYTQKGERASYNLDPFVSRWQGIKTSLYGFPNWVGRYKYVVVAPAMDRRLIEGKQTNRLFDGLVDELGRDNVLFVEQPTPFHYSNSYTKHLVSEGVLFAGCYVMTKLDKSQPVIKNVHILEEIQQRYGMGIDDCRKVREFRYLRKVFRLLFQLTRPKVLFVSCYYGFAQIAIQAAHDLGIKVVEMQHGVIGKAHCAYNVYTDLDKGNFPDYLLVFGRKELETFDNSRFIDPSHVIPVGSFYIDYVKAHPAIINGLGERTVGVSLQLGAEKALVDFVCKAAQIDQSIDYLLIPRVVDSYFDNMDRPCNVRVLKTHNFYEAMTRVDFHATVSSTTAIEAPSFGVRNILVNLEGGSKRFLSHYLPEGDIARYVETPQEMVDAIRTYPAITREQIAKLNEDNIKPNYIQNIRDFIKDYL